jgi:phosphoglycerate dehydrogenase-like enzyme
VAPDGPLYALDNLILTPHVAGLSVEARRELALSAATQVLQVLRGERPPNVVNLEVWDKLEQRLPVIRGDSETPGRAYPGP